MKHLLMIVEDDVSMCDLLEKDLQQRGHRVRCYGTATAALSDLKHEDIGVVLTDLNLPGMNGIDLCRQIVESRPDIPVVVMTAFGSMETAIAAIRAGAYDFVTKPVDLDILAMSLGRALTHKELQEQVRVLREEAEGSGGFQEMIGDSTPMQQLFEQLTRIARTDASVLLLGESGTGKDLVARAIHQRSPRANGPMIALNCSAVPEPLLESEMFGHKRGSFTDAKTDRTGILVEADGGTLLLDEVGSLPLPLQPKLLRVLEDRCVRPVGGNEAVPFDARIVAATNRNLESDVQQGRFREDLFYRLNVIQLTIPPLRTRGTDVLLLANHFARHFSERFAKRVEQITGGAAEKLLSYSWPGNVRELRNAIERAVALTTYDKLTVDDLPDKIRQHRSDLIQFSGTDPGELVTLEEIERRYILHTVNVLGNNRALAARRLGLDRKTLYRKLSKYDARSGGDGRVD